MVLGTMMHWNSSSCDTLVLFLPNSAGLAEFWMAVAANNAFCKAADMEEVAIWGQAWVSACSFCPSVILHATIPCHSTPAESISVWKQTAFDVKNSFVLLCSMVSCTWNCWAKPTMSCSCFHLLQFPTVCNSPKWAIVECSSSGLMPRFCTSKMESMLAVQEGNGGSWPVLCFVQWGPSLHGTALTNFLLSFVGTKNMRSAWLLPIQMTFHVHAACLFPSLPNGSHSRCTYPWLKVALYLSSMANLCIQSCTFHQICSLLPFSCVLLSSLLVARWLSSLSDTLSNTLSRLWSPLLLAMSFTTLFRHAGMMRLPWQILHSQGLLSCKRSRKDCLGCYCFVFESGIATCQAKPAFHRFHSKWNTFQNNPTCSLGQHSVFNSVGRRKHVRLFWKVVQHCGQLCVFSFCKQQICYCISWSQTMSDKDDVSTADPTLLPSNVTPQAPLLWLCCSHLIARQLQKSTLPSCELNMGSLVSTWSPVWNASVLKTQTTASGNLSMGCWFAMSFAAKAKFAKQ